MAVIFSERLKELRIERGLSLAELSEAATINIASLSRWENGINGPKINELVKLAQFFGVSIDYLAGIKHDY